MVNEHLIRLQMELVALETLFLELFEKSTAGASDAEFKAMAARLLAGAERQTIPGADPVYADLYTAELKEATRRLLSRLQSRRPSAF